MTITEFLEARIAEDEKLAEEASVSMHGQRHTEAWDYASYVLSSERDATEAQDKFVAEWWPARVLAECAAKRAILEEHAPVRDENWMSGKDHDYLFCGSCGSLDDAPVAYPCATLEALAAAYADYPDYRQEWSR